MINGELVLAKLKMELCERVENDTERYSSNRDRNLEFLATIAKLEAEDVLKREEDKREREKLEDGLDTLRQLNDMRPLSAVIADALAAFEADDDADEADGEECDDCLIDISDEE